MSENKLLKEFCDIPKEEVGVLKADSIKSFLSEIYPPNDSFINWLITTLAPLGGTALAILLPIIGVNVATISAGGIAGLFGVTVLSSSILSPFIFGAAAALTTGFVVSRKVNNRKSSTASPEDLFCHQTLALLYIPLLYFIRIGKLDRNVEYYENKIKEKFIKMGCTEKYIERFFSCVKKATDKELLELMEMVTRVSAQLQKKAAFTGKLYKKDFKENYLFKLSKDYCYAYNNEFCSDISQKLESETNIENLFNNMVSFHNVESEIQDKISSFEKKYEQESKNLEKNKNIEFDNEVKALKEKLTSEYKEKLKKETEKLEEKRKTEIEEFLNERNSNKNSVIEKYEKSLREESL